MFASLCACGPSPEELAATSFVETDAAANNTSFLATPESAVTLTSIPEQRQKPTMLEILQAREPDFIITIIDKRCMVEGPSEMHPGEYLAALYNQTDLPAVLWMANYRRGGSYEDHLRWREENWGGQGTYCENEGDGEIGYSLVGWMNAKQQAQDGIETYYKVYDVKITREHLFFVSLDRYFGWLCVPVQVKKP